MKGLPLQRTPYEFQHTALWTPEERYHNMKVAANNDPATCRPCHEFEKAEISTRCVELVPSFASQAHAVPLFE